MKNIKKKNCKIQKNNKQVKTLHIPMFSGHHLLPKTHGSEIITCSWKQQFVRVTIISTKKTRRWRNCYFFGILLTMPISMFFMIFQLIPPVLISPTNSLSLSWVYLKIWNQQMFLDIPFLERHTDKNEKMFSHVSTSYKINEKISSFYYNNFSEI